MLRLFPLLFLVLACDLFKGQQSDELALDPSEAKETFYYNLSSVPTTLNPITSTDAYSTIVQSYILEGLLTQDPETAEWEPALAESWSISKDGLVYDFTLREGATWSDGKPVTVEDVKFSFDVIRDPDYNTAHMRPYIENIVSCEIVGERKIRFTANQKYFGNFSSVAGGIIQILPKHIYSKKGEEADKELNRTIVGSGPYVLERFDRRNGLVLRKNDQWWGMNDPRFKDKKYNFKRIFMRFVKDKNIALEMLKKGQLDYDGLDPEVFVQKAVGDDWGKKYFKVKAENSAPKGYSFLAWNLENPIFQDKKVRKALYHLVDRDRMIEKFLFDLSLKATGPLYQQSPYANPEVKAIEYNPELALKLLREAGWQDTDGDRILDKMIDGRKVKLSFTILEPLQDFVKYLTEFQQDAKAAGVEVNIKYVEWNTFIKLLHERKFEAMRLAWSAGSIHWDPKQIWHSGSVDGGSNFISYKNPKVDQLIDEARGIMDHDKRIPKMQEIYKLIAEDYPYVFFFNSQYALYAHTARVQKERDTFKFDIGINYWKLAPQ